VESVALRLSNVTRYVAAGARILVADIDGATEERVMGGLGDNVRYLHSDVTDEYAEDKLSSTAGYIFVCLDVRVNAGALGSRRSLERDMPCTRHHHDRVAC
jgi:NAD(P)-dependent dehydrogenase (short-subunit alcohol dehydrogenase family)